MDIRQRIHRYLAKTPGASTRMVAQHLGVDPSTADYHLRRLRRAARVTLDATGRERAWFNVGCDLCPVLRRAAPAFRRPGVAAVAAALQETPSTIGMLADATRLPRGEARWAFEVLRRIGLAQRSPTGRAMLAPGAATCVAKARAGATCPEWGSASPPAGFRGRSPLRL